MPGPNVEQVKHSNHALHVHLTIGWRRGQLGSFDEDRGVHPLTFCEGSLLDEEVDLSTLDDNSLRYLPVRTTKTVTMPVDVTARSLTFRTHWLPQNV